MMNSAVGIENMSLFTPFENDDDFASKTNKRGSNFSMDEDFAFIFMFYYIYT